MPRYHFNVYSLADGDFVDDQGTDCSSLEDAADQALHSAGETIKTFDAKFLRAAGDWQMTVTDAAGDEQFTLRFTAR